MPIDFYYMPESPPCRLVEMVAELAGVSLNKIYLNLAEGERLNEDFVKLNPSHKVPFIVDADAGVQLSESRAISCYLLNKFKPADLSLYPADPVERARVDELLFIDTGSFYPTSSALFNPLVLGKSKVLDPEAEKSFLENIEMLEERLKTGGQKYFTGDKITIGDLSIASSFQLSQACGYELDDARFKHIKAFLKQIKESVPRYSEINDQPLENMRKYIGAKIEGDDQFSKPVVTSKYDPETQAFWTEECLEGVSFPNIDFKDTTVNWPQVFTTIHAFIAGFKVNNDNVKHCILLCLHEAKNAFDDDRRILEAKYSKTEVTTTITSASWLSTNVDFKDNCQKKDVQIGSSKTVVSTCDKKFSDWYHEEKNENDARVYFALLSIAMLRAAAKDREHITKAIGDKFHAKYQEFTAIKPPDSFPVFDKRSAERVQKFYRAKKNTMNRILACLLRRDRNEMRSRFNIFFEWAIRTPLKWTGFQLYTLAVDVNRLFNLAAVLKELSKRQDCDLYTAQLDNLNRFFLLFSGNAETHREIMGKDLDVSIKYFEYSRIFNRSFFNSLSLEHNLELYWLMIFLHFAAETTYGNAYAARGFKKKKEAISIAMDIRRLMKPSPRFLMEELLISAMWERIMK